MEERRTEDMEAACLLEQGIAIAFAVDAASQEATSLVHKDIWVATDKCTYHRSNLFSP